MSLPLPLPLRDAWRTIRHAPLFAIMVVVTLGLGIGSTTAAFSILDAIVLRGLPYHDADRLRSIYERSDDGKLRVPSYPTATDWMQQAASASDAIEGIAFVRGDGVKIPSIDASERRIVAYVTPGFFQLMGTRPVIGRTFAPDEERAGARVAVISWDLFVGHFGGERATIGRTLDVDGAPTTIIGVMPHAFAFPNFGSGGWVAPALWEPISVFRATHPQLSLRGLHADSRTVVRLKSGVDSARAVAAMHTIQQRLATEYPVEQAHWTSVGIQPIGEAMFSDLRTSIVLVSGALGLVLLLACANVANLFLVRASVRGRELAVRMALGAGRWRLVRQLLTEALALAAVAAVAGLVLAWWLVGIVRTAGADQLPFARELHVDGRVVAFALAVSIVVALLVGGAPALRASSPELMTRMRTGSAGAGVSSRDRGIRHGLVSLQFGLALTLLVGAGLLLQSFRRLASVSLGYDPRELVEFALRPPSPAYDQPAQAAALYRRVLDALQSVRGVQSAATAGGALMPVPIQTEGATSTAPLEGRYHPASAEYRETMRIPLVAGRWFTDDDMRSPVGFVVNQRLARQLWPGASALGRRITVRRSSQARSDFGQPITLPVIGVVGDIKEYGPTDVPEPEVFLPYTLEVWPWMRFVVRTENGARLLPAIERAVRDVEPGVEFLGRPAVQRTGAASLDPTRRFITFTLGGFAAGALLLAAVGLYGIVAYGVLQRTREIGIRIALGASSRKVLTLVLGETVSLVVAGAALGAFGAWASTRLMSSLLFETQLRDAGTLLGAGVLLGVVAMAASYLPARRATQVDPMIAMRTE